MLHRCAMVGIAYVIFRMHKVDMFYLGRALVSLQVFNLVSFTTHAICIAVEIFFFTCLDIWCRLGVRCVPFTGPHDVHT